MPFLRHPVSESCTSLSCGLFGILVSLSQIKTKYLPKVYLVRRGKRRDAADAQRHITHLDT